MKSFKAAFLTFSVALAFTSASFGQDKTEVLLEVEGAPVTVEEFEAIYNKNNVQTQTIEQKSVDEYLELFINFKLKVKEAEALGLDTLASFKNELNGYINQLKEPYLIDQEYNEALMHEAYERMQYDVEASHILVKVSRDASPEDTLKAFKKINAIRRQVVDGTDFEQLAKEKSEDPSAKQNAGYLGYFTVFRMVYPFETAAYNTPVGEVSEVIRSDYGYHVLKVTNKRPAMGQVRAAHIMVKSKPEDERSEQEKAEQKINEIYARLEKGEKFDALARAYSDDKPSAKRGGELPWFGSGRMVVEFEDAVNGLEEEQYSKPFKTRYGWHIVKLLERKGIGSYEEVENTIKTKVSKDMRGQKSRAELVKKLKEEYNVKIWSKSKTAFYELADESLLKGQWQAPVSGLDKKVMRISDKTYGNKEIIYTQADFASFIVENQRKNQAAITVEKMVDELFDLFVEEKMIGYESTVLAQKYPKYKSLVQEYRDGILLFELMDQKVWSKAVKDTAGLKAFYEEHKNEFMWDERAEAQVYTCSNEANAKKVIDMVKEGASDSLIQATLNQDSQLAVAIKSGKFQVEALPVLRKVSWSAGLKPLVVMDQNYVVVNIDTILPAQPKKIDEARGVITAAYQEYLEDEWIKELREKYDYKVNKDALKLVNIQ
ncbi:MAG: peptidylprolyl isomerase [Crocinitomicaceae bacterium]|nr:peptidylprolyl isomerase [Crocinitomicaceae bacterium]